jgi:hypothetical protein
MERGVDMRYQNGIMIIVSLVFAAVATLGTVYPDQFQPASHAESTGFDALAHDLLDDVLNMGPAPEKSK